MRGASSQVTLEVRTRRARAPGVEDPGVLVYSPYPVYVLRAMQNGHSLRMSIPRDVQRHLGIRKGDILAMELREGGRVEFYKVDPASIRRARVFDDPSRSD